MCEKLGLRTTGDKRNLIHRVAKHWKETMDPRSLIKNQIEANVGPVSDASGLPADIRRYYVDNYSSVDRFNRLLYEIPFLRHPHDWVSVFNWGFIHCAVINARAAWCFKRNKRIPVKDFVRELIDEAVKQLRS